MPTQFDNADSTFARWGPLQDARRCASQAAAVCALLDAAGYTDVQSWRDLAGIERVSGGRRGA